MDIETVEQEALRRVNALGGKWKAHEVDRIGNFDVICALITEHRATKAELEAFRREVSQRAEKVLTVARTVNGYANARAVFESELGALVISQPDPLVEVMDAWWDADGYASIETFRAALAARGLELVKKEPSQ